MSISSLQSTTPKPSLDNQGQQASAANNALTGADAKDSDAGSKVKAQVDKQENFFDNFLNRSENKSRPTNKALNTKLADIRHKAKLVKDYPLPNTIREYIKDVKSFLTDVKDHAYEHQLNDEGLFERMKVIDEKLAEVGDQVVEDQKEELKVVASLGELQGLLIDFYI